MGAIPTMLSILAMSANGTADERADAVVAQLEETLANLPSHPPIAREPLPSESKRSGTKEK